MITNISSLWIDDVREPPNNNWHWAKSSAEAIGLIRNVPYRLISFDHDLGGDDTSMKVIDYIEKTVYTQGWYVKFDWKIHSANPVGRANLKRALESIDKRIDELYAKGAWIVGDC